VSLTIVVGTGRCGSTMLSRMLHMHPHVLSLSEFWTIFPEFWTISSDRDFLVSHITGEQFWQIVSSSGSVADALITAGIPLEEYWYPYDRLRFDPATGVPTICRVLATISHDPDALYDSLASEVPSWPLWPIAGHCRALFEKLAAMLGRPVIVERTGGALGKIQVLRQRFPDARFIFLHRDGPDSALSMSRHSVFRLGAMRLLADLLSNSSPPETLPEEIRTASVADLRSITTPPFDAERLMTFPIPVNFFGWIWSTETRKGTNAIREVWRDSWMTLRYEQLLKGTRSELTRLAGFIEIPAERQWLDKACNFVDSGRTGTAAARLDHGEFAELQATCAAGSRAFNLLESEQAASA
jgi:Sulfotransferase family